MKLATTSGDFYHYVENVPDQIRQYKDSKFKYINLEIFTSLEGICSKNKSELERTAYKLQQAADYAGVKYVVAHAPCVYVYDNNQGVINKEKLDILKNSIELCHFLGIERVVVHACPRNDFTMMENYINNKKFYSQFFNLMEKHNIMVLTENWQPTNFPGATGREMREFVEYIDHPLLNVCWDVAHVNMNERSKMVDQYENIMALGDKLKGLHIADNFGDCHHHTWPFAGIINFDSVMQALIDVKYDGYFTFEAPYTLLHHKNIPYYRQPWEHNGETVTKLLDPSLHLKKCAVDLLYETGKYILESYNCFEE